MSAPPSRDELLAAFGDLRVADVRDGMDSVGLFHVGSMSPRIRPLWRTRACGIALTARYLPYDGPLPETTASQYRQWAGWYYREVCPYPWQQQVQPGDFVVIDQSGVNAGLMGSSNTLANVKRGARGFVSNGGVRDTDEVILQRVPFWSAFCSQSMVQCRLRFDAVQVPVQVGGVTVHPGDVVVADGDGVIVVPRSIAMDVAGFAADERRNDMAGRRELYEALGMPPDDTVRSPQDAP
jgi:regulator of RNase E activity RraA